MNILLRQEPDPYKLFTAWYDYRVKSYDGDPTAMALATSDSRASVRMVLLKSYDTSGFVFYTNYNSNKGIHILCNPYGSLLFYWPELKCHIRIEGSIEKTSAEQSDEYFNSRPYLSKIGAHASAQSTIISGRKELMTKVAKLMLKYPVNVPRPARWGGYRLIPDAFEFWRDRPFRLHDRLFYTLSEGNWESYHLSP